MSDLRPGGFRSDDNDDVNNDDDDDADDKDDKDDDNDAGCDRCNDKLALAGPESRLR